MNFHILKGPNFSGRTQRLRQWVGLPNEAGSEVAYTQSAYIGPSAANSLSGIAPTVAAEIEIMAADEDAAAESKQALDMLGFGHCLTQNPFTLSGGEQVAVAILAASSARPQRLAIDCALEQLSPDTRTGVLSYLGNLDGDLMIADNRLDEWHPGPVEEVEAVPGSPLMSPDPSCQPPCNSIEIELVDLCHSYVKNRPILTNLQMKFEAGRQYLLQGANGVGKTTLSKIMCGLLKPTSGEIRVNGRAVEPWRKPGALVGYSFQDPDLQLFANTVTSQLAGAKRLDAVAKWFGLERNLSDHPLDLPFVLRKRLAIASTVGRELGFAILDEPTIGQDRASACCVHDFAAAAGGIIISHSSIYANLDRVTLTRAGTSECRQIHDK